MPLQPETIQPPSGVSATCSRHPDRPAVGICQRCHLPFCGECLNVTPRGDLCRSCTLEETARQAATEKQEKLIRLHRQASRRRHLSTRWRRFILLAFALVIAGDLLVLGVHFHRQSAAVAAHHLWTKGRPRHYVNGLDECIANLWQLRAAMNRYTYEKGSPPENLSQLVPKYLKKLPVCPHTERPYTYTRDPLDENSYRIACPNPGAHDLADLYIDHHKGPPVVVDRGE